MEQLGNVEFYNKKEKLMGQCYNIGPQKKVLSLSRQHLPLRKTKQTLIYNMLRSNATRS